MTSFSYEPLASPDEIRVLDLLPGPGPISCRIRNVRLSDRPHYEALSYCWGTATGQKNISVNGHGFPVGPNLYSALKNLREANQPRCMWIDAICINQTDNNEKNVQVPLMREIYETCQRAVIWLGPSNFLTRRAFRVLKVLLEYSHAWPLGFTRVSVDCWRHAEHNLGQTTGRTAASDRRLNENWFWDRIYDALAFEYLWNRQWFSRVWILQEATVSPDAIVKCGEDEISWSHLTDYWSWNSKADIIPTHAEAPFVNRVSWKRDLAMDLFIAFALNEASSATNPRDKIYGVLAFVRKRDYIGITVDYSKDAADVYLDFTTAVLKARPDLGVLVRSRGVRPNSKTNLPSWSLDWEHDQMQQWWSWTYSGHNHRASIPSPARATKDSKAEVEFIENDKVLGLLGAEVDEVVAVGLGMPDADEWAWTQTFRAYLTWREVAQLDSADVYEPTGQPRREMFWRTMKWFTLYNPVRVEDENAQFDAFDNRVVRLTRFLPKRLFGNQVGAALLTLWDTLLSVGATVRFYTTDPSWLFDASAGWGRAMFRTSSGYVGLGLPNLQPGDRIFLVNGCKAPMAFRPSGNRWKVVGETYVHGIMSGEAFDSSKCERMWVE
ncbi:hypothetical protein NW759_006758 [Fusarium solani]|nr:hypothetical protein NW759_006758 [Fusarium solani]